MNGRTEVSRVCADEYFRMKSQQSFRVDWCFQQYENNYVNAPRKDILKEHPELNEDCWTWRRVLSSGIYRGQVILCCSDPKMWSAA